VFVPSLAYFGYYAATFTPAPGPETLRGERGEAVGVLTLWTLLAIYSRSCLTLLLNEGPWWQRLLPGPPVEGADTRTRRLLRFLNRTHPWFGGAALAMAACHLLLVGPGRANPFLVLTLAVMAWQGLCGGFLRWRLTPQALRRRAHLVHAQLATGVLITIFAAFGHPLLGG
jgi:hypothetical protein